MGIFLGVAKISNILGVLDIPDILGITSRCWVQAYESSKTESPRPLVCEALSKCIQKIIQSEKS